MTIFIQETGLEIIIKKDLRNLVGFPKTLHCNKINDFQMKKRLVVTAKLK